jgi:hypothetical protein
MGISDFARRALGIGGTVALLSGCGGSQTPIGTTGAIPQAPITAAGIHGRAWMLPEAKNHDLIYASSDIHPVTYIFSYEGKLVGSLNVAGGLCSDDVGNVWFAGYPNGKGMELAEYAHGGQEPIKTIDVPNMSPYTCAVDPTTGNLAALGNNGDIDIYHSGSSDPQILVDKKFFPDDLTYDSSGNLFIIAGDGSRELEVAELPKGTTKFELRRGFHGGLTYTSGIRWDGKHLTIGQTLNQGGNLLYRYVVRDNRLERRRGVYIGGYFRAIYFYWIQGSKAVATTFCGTQTCAPIYLVHYPAGDPIRAIGQGEVQSAVAFVTISVAPRKRGP